MEVVLGIIAVVILWIFLTGKNRRARKMKDEICGLVRSGRESAILQDVFFEAALKFALESGAELERGEKAWNTTSIGFQMNIDGTNYFIYFAKQSNSSTFLSVRDADDQMREVRAKFKQTDSSLPDEETDDEYDHEDEPESEAHIEKLRLLNVIKKTNKHNNGAFTDIYSDLNDHIPQTDSAIIMMAYAYAMRTAAAGLVLQAVADRDLYNESSMAFKKVQLMTNQTVEFQEEAAGQSCELLSSYDHRLDKKAIMIITSMVELDKNSELYTGNGETSLPYELVIAGIQKTAAKLK